ncbi:hypothetical protein [Dactylosporangium sp. NPDC048998]|uniref:hypothetical protein n=1 Tax=Dactylosporangium sp. NPDC048998 TaxID=3363976 RepID=UPI003722D6A9
MGLTDRWPHLNEFCRLAAEFPELQVWLFGSALKSSSPADLDVLVTYQDRSIVVALRAARGWDDYDPPLRIIAMTRGEERFYDFKASTGAMRLL